MNTPATTEFFATGGAVPLQSPSYCTRDADEALYAGLLRGEFCYILTTRQIGKTSLTARTAERLREDGLDVAFLDLTEVGTDCNKEQWYYTLLSTVGEDLDLQHELRALWISDSQLTPLQRWLNGIRMILRARPVQRLVIFIDEIDYVRALRFDTSEFFAAIRACYNRRTIDTEFTRLTFCLLGVATPSDLIADVRVTPFNIGSRIELVDFSMEEAASLVHGFRCEPFLGHMLLERVLYWTGGHPYLTQRLCHEIALRPETLTAAQVDRLCADLFLSSAAQERDANLTFVRDRLLKSSADIAELLGLYGLVCRGGKVHHNRANPLIDILLLSGLVRSDGDKIVVRNRIYAHVFDRAWVREHMPDAEQRRQQAAFLRGALRVATVSALLLAIVGSLGLVALYQARRAEEAQRNATRLLYAADMNVVQQALEANNIGHAQELLDVQRPRPGQEDLRGFEWRYFWRLCHGDTSTFHGYNGIVWSVAYSPDGRLLASGSGNGTIYLWNIVSRKGVTLTGHHGWVITVAFSPNGKTLASGGQDHTVKLWDVATSRILKTLTEHTSQVNSVEFSPDGKLLASADNDGTVKLWDMTTRRSLASLRGQKSGVWSVAFSAKGNLLASGSADWTLKLWNVAARRMIKSFKLKGQVNSVAFSHHGRFLAAGQYYGDIELRDLATGHHWPIPHAHRYVVSSLAFSPDDKVLASASWDGTVKLWDVATRREQVTLRGHADMVDSVAFSPDGKTLVTGSNDKTVKLWDVTPRRLTHYSEMLPLHGYHGSVRSLAFSSDGRILGSGSVHGSIIILWDTVTLRPKARLQLHTTVLNSSAFSSDGRLVAFVCPDHTVRLWDVATKRDPCILGRHSDQVRSVAFSPDGKLLASGGDDLTIRLWDTVARHSVGTLHGHTGIVGAVAFSPNGKLLASGGDDKTVRLWNIASQSPIRTLTGHNNDVLSIAFSPDSKMLASASWDRTVMLWDIAGKALIPTLKGHTNMINCVAISPDGKTLVSGSDDDTLKLWNVVTRQEMATFRFPSPVKSATFSRDGDTLAVGLVDGTIDMFEAATPKEVREYEAR